MWVCRRRPSLSTHQGVLLYLPMLRSTRAFLTQAAKISRPTIAPTVFCASSSSSLTPLFLAAHRASSSTSSSASPSYDYDQIMCTTVSNFSSAAGDNTKESSFPSFLFTNSFAFTSMATKTNCYRYVDEPAGSEDYDVYELHHSICQRTEYDPHGICTLTGW